jgi:hypothetical protein
MACGIVEIYTKRERLVCGMNARRCDVVDVMVTIIILGVWHFELYLIHAVAPALVRDALAIATPVLVGPAPPVLTERLVRHVRAVVVEVAQQAVVDGGQLVVTFKHGHCWGQSPA